MHAIHGGDQSIKPTADSTMRFHAGKLNGCVSKRKLATTLGCFRPCGGFFFFFFNCRTLKRSSGRRLISSYSDMYACISHVSAWQLGAVYDISRMQTRCNAGSLFAMICLENAILCECGFLRSSAFIHSCLRKCSVDLRVTAGAGLVSGGGARCEERRA